MSVYQTGGNYPGFTAAEKIKALEAERHRLQEELSRYQGIAAEAEAERDQLRERVRWLEARMEEAGGVMPDPQHPHFPREFYDRQCMAAALMVDDSNPSEELRAALAGEDT